jgi:rhodanese-related sulfurtransferase
LTDGVASSRRRSAHDALTAPRAAASIRAMPFRDLDPKAAEQALRADPTLRVLDVRTDEEYRSHRLPGAVLLPVQELEDRWQELDRDANWLVHCEHGRRSLFACEFLHQAGFTRLTNLRGGLAHWLDCGLPVEQ